MIYENGVFRPLQPVDLPERCEVEVDIRAVNRESPPVNLDDAYAVRGRRRSPGEHDESARPNERDIESNPDEELQTVWESCSTPDWDGYGALAVSQEALLNGRRFLESLPQELPTPSIGAEPDGALTLEWHYSDRRTLSVSVSSGEELQGLPMMRIAISASAGSNGRFPAAPVRQSSRDGSRRSLGTVRVRQPAGNNLPAVRCGRSLTEPPADRRSPRSRETFGRRFRRGRRPSPSTVDYFLRVALEEAIRS